MITKTKIRGYTCEKCGGTLVGTTKRDPRSNFIWKKGKVLKVCRNCLEQHSE